MWIAVCDDEKAENENLLKMINDYAIKYDYDIHCEAFTSGKALLCSKRIYDMYILDYQMDEMNGMELARILRNEKNVEAYIVFLTAYMHFVQEAFKVNTHRFLHKPVNPDELYEALNSLMLPTVYSRHISLRRVTQEDVIYTKDIVCIEACGKNSLVTIKDSSRAVEYHHLLKDIFDMLPEQLFFKVQRSYIVNFEYIRNYSKRNRTIEMKNGNTVPVSKDMFDDFIKAYNQYVARFK